MEEHLRLMQRSRGVQYLREYVDRSDWKIGFQVTALRSSVRKYVFRECNRLHRQAFETNERN